MNNVIILTYTYLNLNFNTIIIIIITIIGTLIYVLTAKQLYHWKNAVKLTLSSLHFTSNTHTATIIVINCVKKQNKNVKITFWFPPQNLISDRIYA